MRTTAFLSALVLVNLAALELLNALYEAFHKGHTQGLADRAKGARPAGWLALALYPLTLLRVLVAYVALAGEKVSLYLHELSHAAAQAAFLARPRVVMCKNGGFAQALPWIKGFPFNWVYAVGQLMGRGVISMAPALVMGAMLYAALHFLLPLPTGTLGGLEATLVSAADTPQGLWAAVRSVVRFFLQALQHGNALGVVGMVIAGLLLISHLTPSSVDFWIARYALPGYGAAAVLATGLYQRSAIPTVLLLAIGALGVASLPLFARPKAWTGDFGRGIVTFLLACGGIGLAVKFGARGEGANPVAALQASVAAVAVVLLLSATLYAVLLAGFAASTVLTFRLGPIWRLLRGVPRELAMVFTFFNTCETCNLHYTRVCDGCGRKA